MNVVFVMSCLTSQICTPVPVYVDAPVVDAPLRIVRRPAVESRKSSAAAFANRSRAAAGGAAGNPMMPSQHVLTRFGFGAVVELIHFWPTVPSTFWIAVRVQPATGC